MATKDLLSQDEMDALLKGVENGEVKTTEEAPPQDGIARAYDFTNQQVRTHRLPGLTAINDRFVRHFGNNLSRMLDCAVDVSVGGTRTVKFTEYAQSLFVPASLNFAHAKPLPGAALLAFDPKLVSAVINHFFGGDARFRSQIERSEFTTLEQHLIERILQQAFRDLKEAWTPVAALDFEYFKTETNPQFVNLIGANEAVIVTVLRIELKGDGGDLHVAFPYSMLEPVREWLQGAAPGAREERTSSLAVKLREEIKEVVVEVETSLTQTEISVRELLDLKPGDVIPVGLPDWVVLRVQGIPLFRGQYGVSRGASAVKILEPIRATK